MLRDDAQRQKWRQINIGDVSDSGALKIWVKKCSIWSLQMKDLKLSLINLTASKKYEYIFFLVKWKKENT